ncbi:MAG: DNA-binding protein WhiA [Lachnospiraceae bacterium]|nr:DNA-binding protein WhiA [Lachnospiraceae bacterium]
MSFSQLVKREIREKLSKKTEGFTIPQNTNNIIQTDFRAPEGTDGVSAKEPEGTGAVSAKEQDDAKILAWFFVNKGSVNDPKSSYHLEIACDTADEAETVAELMDKNGFKVKTASRKGKHIVYLKERETIADFLGFIGAVSAMMEMENSLILKDMRNSVNRRVNFEAANIERTVGAALKDIEAIRYIETHGGLKKLPEGLRRIAEARLEYPDASLQSLGEKMEPRLGKSGVNHRLRKIREYADGLGMPGQKGESNEKK